MRKSIKNQKISRDYSWYEIDVSFVNRVVEIHLRKITGKIRQGIQLRKMIPS